MQLEPGPPSIVITSPPNGSFVPPGVPLPVSGDVFNDGPPITVTLTNNNWQQGDPPQTQILPGQMLGATRWQTIGSFQIPNRAGVSLSIDAQAALSSTGIGVTTG
jgi:hypothetical protein